ncbi:caspase family protein [Sulfitobacter sp. F26204]|uniref:caspase family protein n=1 Tax=Sulfitobacter sp. F26204 TaxID=2996014 RepID=UPI00225E52EA|nr:caspase family protein [Sulfitobacter sp. F26204]MCX7560145.1 caspase family protein [Sulfitobacter sp. F26204]
MASEKVALVIGNSKYRNVFVLPNAAQDAIDVAQVLGKLGFRVIHGTDLTRVEILEHAQDLRRSLAPDDIALFYFSGHAIQIGAENFIIPVDAFGQDEQTVRNNSVKLQTVLSEMESKADRNIVILDACRNNPFDIPAANRAIGGAARGLAKVDAGVGSFIAFSTQPGNVALDGNGRNSPFTAALLRHLPSQADDLHEVMRKVRRDVVEDTNSSQIPWENSSMIQRIYLASHPARTEPVAPSTERPRPAAQPVFGYEVAGLDPYGDGFLALRNGTTPSATRILKMTEGTRLEVLGQDGVWFHVRTETGAIGWAHSNWIGFVGARSNQPTESCESLWMQRNAIFARNGYCFQGARGRKAFSNAGCRVGVAAGDIPLSAAERNEVEFLRSREKLLQCR